MRRDWSASSVVAAITSLFASADIASVSSVMKVLLTQSARLYLRFKSNKRFSASAINFSASAGVAFAPEPGPGSEFFAQDDINSSPRLASRNAPIQTAPLREIKFMLPPLADELTN